MITLVVSSIYPNQLVKAASSPWTQTDWSSGVGSSTTNQYSAASNIDATTTGGQFSLTQSAEKLTNTGFETDLSSWNAGILPSSISGLKLWVGADQIVGLNDGDSVSTWTDQSGAGNNMTQATPSRKPIYKTNSLNGKPVLRFSAAAQSTINTTTNFPAPFTVIYAARQNGPTRARVLTALGNNWLLGWWGGGKTQAYFEGWLSSAGSPAADSNAYIYTGQGTGALSTVFENGTQKFQSGSGLAGPNGLAMGYLGSSEFSDADIAEILVYNNVLSATDRKNAEAYLQAKYDIASGNLILTRDTTTKRTGAGSMKVVAGTNGGNLAQSINLGDTNKYNLSTYAYIDGSTAVDNTYAELFYDGTAIGTTYTDVGGGWYKLSAVITGANASKTFGVQVKANKTIYLDDFSLTNYTSGNVTSNIFDTGFLSDWGATTYSTGGTGSISVKARTSNSSSMVGAPDYATCSTITSGDDISSKTCVADMNQYVQYQVTLTATDTSVTPNFLSISIAFTPSDQGDPNNPTSLSTTSSQKTGGTNITTNTWLGYASPYFGWNEPTDPPDGNGISTGIAGYYVYFGTSSTGDPYQSRGIATELGETGKHYQTDRDFEVGVDTSAMTSGQTYYLRIATKDNAGRIKHLANEDPSLFKYIYDGDKPETPHYVSVDPSGYSSSKAFAFTWPTAQSEDANAAATDTGGSELLGYQYKINNDATWYGASHTGAANDFIPYTTGTFTIPEADYGLVAQGSNVFHLRTLDNAGNTSATNNEVPFKFNNTAPDPPTSLNVTPTYNTINDFSFNWHAATGKNNTTITRYYYSVNDPDFPKKGVLCTVDTQCTTDIKLEHTSLATRQSPLKNRFYLVAEDSAGNVDFGNPAWIDFEANTPAPGAPVSLKATDQSIRTVKYKVGLAWYSPDYIGTGISYYNVYRKTDSGDWTFLESRTTTDYTDNNVEIKKVYSYRVTALDSANKESDYSSIAEISPKGEYESPATIDANSLEVTVTSRTAIIHWDTDSNDVGGFIHKTDSMVAYGKTENLESAKINESLVTSHTIELDGLEPLTKYYYRISGMDENDNKTLGDAGQHFTTEAATTITNRDKKIKIAQTEVTLEWDSSRVITKELRYGKTTSYDLTYPKIGSDDVISRGTNHVVTLKGLEAGTQYFYQIVGTDTYGDVIVSDNYSFTTKPYPIILNITFQPIKTAAATTIDVAWETNVPTNSRVKFTPTDGSNPREEINADYKTSHKFTIGGGKLLDNKTYIFKATVSDTDGNEATSDNQTYTTPEDTRPPVISNFQSEVSVEGAGDTAKVSAIITWDTDEPSDSQVFYGAGTSGSFDNSTGRDAALASSHMVVISDLKAAQTYHVKAKSADKSGNMGESDAQNFVTNQPSQSVISIILSRLQQTFGWMTSISSLFGN